jgi:hypothetical protein
VTAARAPRLIFDRIVWARERERESHLAGGCGLRQVRGEARLQLRLVLLLLLLHLVRHVHHVHGQHVHGRGEVRQVGRLLLLMLLLRDGGVVEVHLRQRLLRLGHRQRLQRRERLGPLSSCSV